MIVQRAHLATIVLMERQLLVQQVISVLLTHMLNLVTLLSLVVKFLQVRSHLVIRPIHIVLEQQELVQHAHLVSRLNIILVLRMTISVPWHVSPLVLAQIVRVVAV